MLTIDERFGMLSWLRERVAAEVAAVERANSELESGLLNQAAELKKKDEELDAAQRRIAHLEDKLSEVDCDYRRLLNNTLTRGVGVSEVYGVLPEGDVVLQVLSIDAGRVRVQIPSAWPAACNTLRGLDYIYGGGEQWKPPLGVRPTKARFSVLLSAYLNAREAGANSDAAARAARHLDGFIQELRK
jgi:hypothetical protein